MSAVNERWLQCGLILVWLAIVVVDSVAPASCQGCAPPLVTPGYMDPITITNGSWAPSTSVTVKISDEYGFWSSESADRIAEGTEKWESIFPCTLVSFNSFEVVEFDDENVAQGFPPFHHHYWVVAFPAPDPVTGAIPNGRTASDIGFGGRVVGAITMIRPDMAFNSNSDPSLFNYLGTHEVGHTFNLKDCLSTTNPACMSPQLTIMSGHGNTSFNTTGPTACDLNAVRNIYCPSPSPSPSPSPTAEPTPPPDNPEDCQAANGFWNFASPGCFPVPQTCNQHCTPYFPLESGGCESPVDYCGFQWGCGFGFTDGGQGCCCGATPILIDVAGNGFSLTDAYTGVHFDMGGDGRREPIAWTTEGTDDAWLVLDRNDNGAIDSAREMFGNLTDQPNATSERHGFIALAEFDRPENGGNSDGKITKTDSVFSRLRLWQDVNKNGLSEPSELHSLKELGLKTIELDFKVSRRTDQHGNQFKYRAKIKDNKDAQMGRWAWDVVLLVNPPPRP
jgi:hypothetical protein